MLFVITWLFRSTFHSKSQLWREVLHCWVLWEYTWSACSMMAAIASGSAQTPEQKDLCDFSWHGQRRRQTVTVMPLVLYFYSPARTLSVVGQRLHTLCTKATPLKKENKKLQEGCFPADLLTTIQFLWFITAYYIFKWKWNEKGSFSKILFH